MARPVSVRPLLAALVLLAAPALAAQEAPAVARTVYLVRHAEKAAEPAADPVLTEAGARRAEALRDALASAKVGSVVTSDRQRTRLTAEPLMRAQGIATVVVVPVGKDLDEHVEAVAAAVRARPAGEAVLVVGHSNTIPAIVGALGGPELPDLCDRQHAELFTLHLIAGREPHLVRGTYGAPDPADADGCTRTMAPSR